MRWRHCCVIGKQVFAACADAQAAALQAVFTVLRDSRQQHGAGATGLYIISMARSAADVLAVLALARRGGLVAASAAAGRGTDDVVPLDIAPLFETVDDLQNAPATLQALLDDPVYRQHLAARDDQQWVMLGYSDSGKDGGTLASRWGLQRAQVRLLEVAHAANIRLAFFHGRGGSASRGGGRMTPALMSSPRGAVAGVLRVTEQGEVIHRKYGIRALALRNLEQTVGAVLRASLRPREAESREQCWRRDRADDPRFAPGQPPQHAWRAGSAGDPVGVRVDPVPRHHSGLVRPGQRAGIWRAAVWCRGHERDGA